MGRKLGAKLHKKAYVAMNETFIKGVTYKIGEDHMQNQKPLAEQLKEMQEVEEVVISPEEAYETALKELGVTASMTTAEIECAYDELVEKSDLTVEAEECELELMVLAQEQMISELNKNLKTIKQYREKH